LIESAITNIPDSGLAAAVYLCRADCEFIENTPWERRRSVTNIGDIYAFYSKRLDCYHTCQITGFRNQTDKKTEKPLRPLPAVLLLDWAGNANPALRTSRP
jgi:hypothetical protein